MTLANALAGIARQVGEDMRTAWGWSPSIRIFVNDAKVPQSAREYGEIEVSVPEIQRKGGPQFNVALVRVEINGRFPDPGSGLRFDLQTEKLRAIYPKFTPTMSLDGRSHYAVIEGEPVGDQCTVVSVDLQDLEANELGCVDVGLTVEMLVRVQRAA